MGSEMCIRDRSPSLSASSKGGVDGGALSIQSAAMPTAVACQRNRLVVPMSGSFNASSRRMLMVMFVLDMCTSIVILPWSCN